MTTLALAPELDALPAIGLDELNATASLLTRADRKYILPAEELNGILTALPIGSRALEVHGERTPAYDTVYLDTADLDACFATARRRPRRWKVRQRTYVASAVHFLEVKTKTGPLTVKRRLPWPDVSGVQGSGGSFVAACLSESGVAVDPGRLVPQLRTTYRRATIALPGPPVRMTIDVDLAWGIPGQPEEPAWPGTVIIETKTPGQPCLIDRALWRAGHRPVSLSKYACGLAALRPELPSNRWHRLLAAA